MSISVHSKEKNQVKVDFEAETLAQTNWGDVKATLNEGVDKEDIKQEEKDHKKKALDILEKHKDDPRFAEIAKRVSGDDDILSNQDLKELADEAIKLEKAINEGPSINDKGHLDMHGTTPRKGDTWNKEAIEWMKSKFGLSDDEIKKSFDLKPDGSGTVKSNTIGEALGDAGADSAKVDVGRVLLGVFSLGISEIDPHESNDHILGEGDKEQQKTLKDKINQSVDGGEIKPNKDISVHAGEGEKVEKINWGVALDKIGPNTVFNDDALKWLEDRGLVDLKSMLGDDKKIKPEYIDALRTFFDDKAGGKTLDGGFDFKAMNEDLKKLKGDVDAKKDTPPPPKNEGE